jgi:hypothetical protein
VGRVAVCKHELKKIVLSAAASAIRGTSECWHDDFRCLRCSGVDPKTQELKKGKPNVVMFVGLQVGIAPAVIPVSDTA